MERIDAILAEQATGEAGLRPQSGPALADLDTLVAEVGASYPLLAYAAPGADEEDEASALDSMILAGLVTP